MSTYDAYNLSLRDSTEFTVPTGGSGGDSQFSTYNLKIRNTAGTYVTIHIPYVIDMEYVNKFAELVGVSVDDALAFVGGSVPQIGTIAMIPTANTYSEFKVIAINGVSCLTFSESPRITVDNISENIEEIQANISYKITGDAVIDCHAGSIS